MKLTTITQATLDRVMQGTAARPRKREGDGFDRGGWTLGQVITRPTQRADAFLFGPWTYELSAGSWASWNTSDVPDWEPVLQVLNTRPEYVASTTLTDTAWPRTTVLPGNPATTSQILL
ncbi:hypothetical protein ETD83_33085 [Actinomadura soli]|uniref:Uncharacterized protein n=1 Tax=Actinomadura soli TaxID=2508997 RepID=A0A5C4J2G9_9ACTN|nr:hypothetical protein [Actinomadura soli]TMQ90964.1 hypothetical protein ETD83_33085 [Actinomadura soli]